MANKRIEDLNEAFSVLTDDLLIISQNGRASKLKWNVIKQYIDENGGGGGGGDAIAIFSNSVAKTYTDILEAYTANKVCVFIKREGDAGYIYSLARIDTKTQNAYFERVDTATRTLYQINVNPFFGTMGALESEASISMSGTNFLRNWYFANPVNSRGLTTYEGETYTADGWKSSTAQNKVELTYYGLKMSKIAGHAGANTQYIYQDVDVENSDNLVGRYVTVSAFVRGTCRVGMQYAGTDLGNSGYKTFENFGVVSYTTWISEKLTDARIRVYIGCENGGTFEVNKAKLEVGEASTIDIDSPQIYALEQYKCYVSTADPTDDHANKDIFSSEIPWEEIHSNTEVRHTHTNKPVLDAIDAERVDTWDNKADPSEIPDALPNPGALHFIGGVTATYDGSEEMTVNIPTGGGGGGSMAYLNITLGGTTYKYNGSTEININISSANGVSF